MHITVPHTGFWPLRTLGLEPGRALANADPKSPDVAQRRADQYAYIVAGLAATHSDVRRQTADRPGAFASQRRTAR